MIHAAPHIRLVADGPLQAHPAAEIFPLMTGADFDALVADIKANGQREPIIVTDGQILDGRNRYRACEQLGLTAKITDWDRKGTPEAFVVSMNLHRRHLNESQRAMIAAKLATRTRKDSLIPNAFNVGKLEVQIGTSSMSAQQAADLLNVGRHTVFSAKKVLKSGSPEEIRAIESGETGVSTVAKGIAGATPEPRKKHREPPLSQNGKNPERIQRMQMHADIWALLSGALEALTALPLPADVVEIVNANTKRRQLVDEKLARSLQWLKDFEHACRRG